MNAPHQNNEQPWSWVFDGIALTWFVESRHKGESQVCNRSLSVLSFLLHSITIVTPQDMRCQVDESTMYLQEKRYIATFTRPVQDVVPANRRDEQPFKLLLFPEGQQYLDYILLSALIIERMRSI